MNKQTEKALSAISIIESLQLILTTIHIVSFITVTMYTFLHINRIEVLTIGVIISLPHLFIIFSTIKNKKIKNLTIFALYDYKKFKNTLDNAISINNIKKINHDSLDWNELYTLKDIFESSYKAR